MLSIAAASVAFSGLAPVTNSINVNMFFGKKQEAVLATPESLAFPDPIAGHIAIPSVDDITWDPLKLANEENLEWNREAEIKHGRLAMLACLGWPAAEKLEPIFSKMLNLEDELIETGGRAPSLLNGGLEEGQIPMFLGAVFLGAGIIEGAQRDRKLKLDAVAQPGDVGFDPLSLFPEDPAEQDKYRLAELKHARVAMIAIGLYVLEEAISGTSILQETVPLFSEIERLAAEGPTQGLADLGKDIVNDVIALEADTEKVAKLYEDASRIGESRLTK